MKYSTIKSPSYEEALAKKRAKDALRAKNPVKRQIGANKRVLETKARKTKRPKKPKLAKLKKTLWSLCREIQIKTHGSDCYTCGAKELTGSNRHLGHFISSSICSVELRYDLRNLRIQCYACNIHKSGNWLAYENRLKIDHGQDYVDRLKARNEETKGKQYTSLWYENKITEYTSLLKTL